MSKEVDRSVERIGYSYGQTVQIIENRAHVCTPDESDRLGRCKFCPKIPSLAAGARTGELQWTSER